MLLKPGNNFNGGMRAGTETRRKVKPDGQELLHKKFIKRVLGVFDSTPDIILMGEV